MHKRLLISLALPLAMLSTARAAEALLDQDATLKSAALVTSSNYPDADTVLVDDSVHVAYATNGTDETWDDTYMKVLTEKGRQDMQALTFGYNLFYDTVTVVRAEVVKPDGREEKVDVAAQSQSMVDRSQMQFNIYDPNDRVLQVSIPDVEAGDVVHYLAHHRTLRTRMPDEWDDYQVFESTSPIKHYLYEVDAPEERPLRRMALKDPVAGTVTATTNRAAGRIVYRWEVRDVPRFFEEPNMPDAYSVVQRLLVSTVPDWQTVSKWYWNISAPHYDATTPELVAKVRELTADAKTEREKIQRLFTFVSQQIRYMGITTEKEAPGYEPHDVGITFSQRYGVCRDKAALLVSMLRLADIKAYPVMIHAGPKRDAEVPMPYFNHAIVAAQEEGTTNYLLMDPTDETTTDLLPTYLCDKSYLVARPEGETLLTSPIVPATNNLMRIESLGRLDDSGTLRLQATLDFSGINDNAYRGYLAQVSPDERRQIFDERIGRALPGARLTDLVIAPTNLSDTTQPLQVKLACEVPDYAVQSDSYELLALPWIGQSFGTVNRLLGQTGLEKRRFPLRTDIACGVEENVRVELDSTVKPLSLPSAPAIRRDDLEFTMSVEATNSSLLGSESFLLKAVEYAPDHYAALKQSLRDIEYARRQRVVLPRQVAAAPTTDAEILRHDVAIAIRDAHEWTTTENYDVRILSYAGKKRLSELHLDYNPAWEDIHVTNVTVRSHDGNVQRIAAQELNVMDASWVASAPRYPAAKTLVASLPGVEIGSELQFTVVRHAHDHPFFSAISTFRGFDAVREASLSVASPLSLKLRQSMAGDFEATTATNGGTLLQTWSISEQPALAREDNMPPLWSDCPYVALSCGDWSDYAAAVLDPMVKASHGNPEARALAKQLARKESGRMAKATAIRDEVDRSIRLAGPEADDLPLSVLTGADQTLREGYGNSRDRALLLYVMLDEAGFKPDFVLASSSTPLVQDLRERWLAVPQSDTFDDVLVRANIEGHDVYFNDTDQYARLGSTPHDGRAGLDRRGGFLTIASLPDQKSRIETDEELNIDSNGEAVITVRTRYYGLLYADFHKQMAEQTPEDRRRFAQETVAALSQAAQLVGTFDVKDAAYPGEIRFTARAPRYAVRDGRLLYFTLPGVRGVELPGEETERRNPFYSEDDSEHTITYELTLPPGEMEIEPSPFDLTAPGGIGRAVSSAVEKSGASGYRLERDYQLRPALVPGFRYSDLKEWNARILHPDNRSFMFRLAP